MIKAYLTSYFRNLVRNKATSFINIFGLSIGLASCFIIMLFVINELRVDRFQKNRKSVYRILTEGQDHALSTFSPFLSGPSARQELPEVEAYTRFIYLGSVKVKKENTYLEEPNFQFADQSVFDLLTFHFLEGKAADAITNPNNVVISESMARKYFGNGNALGNKLELSIKGEEQVLSVSGIFADLPKTTSIRIDFIGNLQFGKRNLMKMFIYYGTGEAPKMDPDSWEHNFYTNFIKVADKTDVSKLEYKLNKAFKKYQVKENSFNYKLQRYDRIYLHTPINDSQWTTGKLSDIYLYSAIAFLILLIACFNYVILSLAQSEKRSKEIGIRKVSGANFRKLNTQVIVESVVISVISLPIAIGLTELLLPIVNAFFDRHLVVEYLNNLVFIVGIFVIVVTASLISGLYISIYLNKYNPVTILRGVSVRSGVRSVFLKTLVIIQMAIFIGLIISSVVILKQLHFVANYHPGIDPKNVLSIKINDFLAKKNYQVFKEELEKLPEVAFVSATANNPPSSFTMNMSLPRVDDPGKMATLEVLMTDFNYIETLGLSMKEGRSFSRSFPSDSTAVILNESAIPEMGLTNPVGKKLSIGTVIGIMRDFPIHNLYSKIPAAYMVINSQNLFEMAVRTKVDVKLVVPKIEAIWKRINPDTKFNCIELSDKTKEEYQSEQRLASIIILFTVIAILIATLGLYALSFYITIRRTKEIGIRKVNGGTLSQMILLFWKEIFFWTCIAFLAACPVSWYMMNRWLANFAYHTSLNWWIFALAGVLALVLALLTVSWQAYRTAVKNPVDSLRYE